MQTARSYNEEEKQTTKKGIGVEQIFLLHSPKIVSITKKQKAKVRQAKLYYIRELSGKATRLKRKF